MLLADRSGDVLGRALSVGGKWAKLGRLAKGSEISSLGVPVGVRSGE